MCGRVGAACGKHRAVRRYADRYRRAGEPMHLAGVEFGKAAVSVDSCSGDIHEYEGSCSGTRASIGRLRTRPRGWDRRVGGMLIVHRCSAEVACGGSY